MFGKLRNSTGRCRAFGGDCSPWLKPRGAVRSAQTEEKPEETDSTVTVIDYYSSDMALAKPKSETSTSSTVKPAGSKTSKSAKSVPNTDVQFGLKRFISVSATAAVALIAFVLIKYKKH